MPKKPKAPYGDDQIIAAITSQTVVAQQMARAIGLKQDDEMSFVWSATVSTVSSLLETMVSMDVDGHGAMVDMLYDHVVKPHHNKNVQVRKALEELRSREKPGPEVH